MKRVDTIQERYKSFERLKNQSLVIKDNEQSSVTWKADDMMTTWQHVTLAGSNIVFVGDRELAVFAHYRSEANDPSVRLKGALRWVAGFAQSHQYGLEKMKIGMGASFPRTYDLDKMFDDCVVILGRILCDRWWGSTKEDWDGILAEDEIDDTIGSDEKLIDKMTGEDLINYCNTFPSNYPFIDKFFENVDEARRLILYQDRPPLSISCDVHEFLGNLGFELDYELGVVLPLAFVDSVCIAKRILALMEEQ